MRERIITSSLPTLCVFKHSKSERSLPPFIPSLRSFCSSKGSRHQFSLCVPTAIVDPAFFPHFPPSSLVADPPKLFQIFPELKFTLPFFLLVQLPSPPPPPLSFIGSLILDSSFERDRGLHAVAVCRFFSTLPGFRVRVPFSPPFFSLPVPRVRILPHMFPSRSYRRPPCKLFFQAALLTFPVRRSFLWSKFICSFPFVF